MSRVADNDRKDEANDSGNECGSDNEDSEFDEIGSDRIGNLEHRLKANKFVFEKVINANKEINQTVDDEQKSDDDGDAIEIILVGIVWKFLLFCVILF
ncbi:MAG: hypothetical protein GY928_16180 [Colwellia sp.]|nr:hypothetical protein [Colwellia sp.]